MQPQPNTYYGHGGVALYRKMVLPAGSHMNSQKRFLEPFTLVPVTFDIHSVLVIYACITNYPILIDFYQPTFIIWEFLWVGNVEAAWLGDSGLELLMRL